MSALRKSVLFCLTPIALLLAISYVNAATTAPAPTKVATVKSSTEKSAKPKTKLKLGKNDTVIYVGDLHCKHCAKSLAGKLYTLKEVVKVRTDLKADVAIISPQPKKQLDPLELWKAAGKSGFPALKLEGPTGTYVADAKTKVPKLVPKKKTAAAAPRKS